MLLPPSDFWPDPPREPVPLLLDPPEAPLDDDVRALAVKPPSPAPLLLLLVWPLEPLLWPLLPLLPLEPGLSVGSPPLLPWSSPPLAAPEELAPLLLLVWPLEPLLWPLVPLLPLEPGLSVGSPPLLP